jgi:stearoyl-CoA desaturase (delta-9 desaturase)
MFQDKYYVPLVIAVHAGILLPVGWLVGDIWGVLLLGGLVRLFLSHHVTFFINSLCHMWGKRPYTDENTARDNFIAILTWGEAIITITIFSNTITVMVLNGGNMTLQNG